MLGKNMEYEIKKIKAQTISSWLARMTKKNENVEKWDNLKFIYGKFIDDWIISQREYVG